jgi:hypothetical protein
MLTDPVGTNEITHQIIGAAIKVHRALGQGCSNRRTRSALHSNCENSAFP